MSDTHVVSIVTSSPRLRALLVDADVDPPAQLWPRIVAEHSRRSQQRQRRLFAGSLALAAGLLVALLVPRFAQHTAGNIQQTDWKFEAQRLELQLLDLNKTRAGHDHLLSPEQADLEALDHSLQAAYDRAASKTELMSLWQRRCALLNTLLTIRSQPLELTRI